MCQLTLLDLNDGLLDPKFLYSQLAINTLEGHFDGFGYYTFEDHLLYKTEKSFTTWFSSNHASVKKFKSYLNYNGIYHVRMASTNKENINKDTAHPHRLGNIILSHNGTFTKLYHKTLSDIFKCYNKPVHEVSDSVEFLMALHYYSYGEGSKDKGVTDDTIKKALNLFNGNFVLFIVDLGNPDYMFVVKDERVKPLAQAVITKGKDVVGLVLNSKWYALHSNVYTYKNVYAGTDLEFSISEVAGNKIYHYAYGSYDLVESSKLPVTHTTPELDLTTPKSNVFHVKSRRNYDVSELFNSINSIIESAFINMDDMIILYEILFEKSILSYTDSDKASFMLFLDAVCKKSNNDKDLLYSQLLAVCKNKFAAYADTNLQYPYTLNTVEELKVAINTIYADAPQI